jgi:hypothetical protein
LLTTERRSEIVFASSVTQLARDDGSKQLGDTHSLLCAHHAVHFVVDQLLQHGHVVRS